MGFRQAKKMNEKWTSHKNKKAQTTFYYEVPEESHTDTWVITVASDRLDKLALQYYGDQYLWWYICLVNELEPTMNIAAGTKLRLPKRRPQIG